MWPVLSSRSIPLDIKVLFLFISSLSSRHLMLLLQLRVCCRLQFHLNLNGFFQTNASILSAISLLFFNVVLFGAFKLQKTMFSTTAHCKISLKFFARVDMWCIYNLKSLDYQQRTFTLSKEKQQVIFEDVIAANVHGVSITAVLLRFNFWLPVIVSWSQRKGPQLSSTHYTKCNLPLCHS